MLGKRGHKQPMRHPNLHYYQLHHYTRNEDSTLVKEHCELLVLRPCPVSDEVDVAPAILGNILCSPLALSWICGGGRLKVNLQEKNIIR